MAKSALSRAYDSLPRLGQTLALNSYGLRNRRRRRRWEAILDGLKASETWTPDRQRDYVREKLRAVMRHAVASVPKYASLRRLGPDLESPEAPVFEILQEFPIITRDEVLSDPEGFFSASFRRQELVSTVTSGTTGTPFETFMDRDTLQVSDALWWRRTVWAGWEPGDWIARLVGDPVIPLHQSNPSRPWRSSWTDRRLYFSTFHLNATTANGIARCLAAKKPAFLMGYPSALDSLSRLVNHRFPAGSWRPKAILYSSEPLHAHQRQAIADLIEAPVRGIYGCAERIVSASECEHGLYHLSLVDGYVEGQFGQLPSSRPALVSGLLNLAMPLIRFRLGDDLEPLVGVRCPCGRTLPAIKSVVTKHEDCLLTPSGRHVSPSTLTFAFKDISRLQKSQLVQTGPGEVEVLLQSSEPDFERISSVLLPRLQQIVFDELQFSFRRVDELDITGAGKSRFVIRNHAP